MSVTRTKRRYLWVFSAANRWTLHWHQRLLARRRAQGYDIRGFCITPPRLERRWLPFPELDHRWRHGDIDLYKIYNSLTACACDRDVLVLYNGANLHPDFVSKFDLIKVYTAGDDPESTEILTRPIAPAFDIHLINNISCVDMYRSWGLSRVEFWPLGSQVCLDEVDDITESSILETTHRRVPIVFFGERQVLRNDRLLRVAAAFPNAFLAGRGWPRGFVPWDEMWNIYRQARVGWNFHNSTGPINFRTYDLPAHGILQICDNKTMLDGIFKVGSEAIGFDTVEECIERTTHYLQHPEEAAMIALAGHRRWKRDYHPDRVWQRLTEAVDRYFPIPLSPSPRPVVELTSVAPRLSRNRASILVAFTTWLLDRIKRTTRPWRSFMNNLWNHIIP